MHSWRVLVLPFAEATGFPSAYNFQEPWNGPHNRLLADDTPDTFIGSNLRPYQSGARCEFLPLSGDIKILGPDVHELRDVD